MNSIFELPSRHCKEGNKASFCFHVNDGVPHFCKKRKTVTHHFSVLSTLIVLCFPCVSFVSTSAELIWNDLLQGFAEKLLKSDELAGLHACIPGTVKCLFTEHHMSRLEMKEKSKTSSGGDCQQNTNQKRSREIADFKVEANEKTHVWADIISTGPHKFSESLFCTKRSSWG